MNWFHGMQYNSILFLIFIAIFYLVYFAVPKNSFKVAVIILGNLFFYFSLAGIEELIVVIATSMVVYLFSILIDNIYRKAEKEKPDGLSLKKELKYWNEPKKKGKRYMVAGIVIILSVLVYVKAGKILRWEEVDSVKDLRMRTIFVPLGLSYYTFSSIGYLVDIYKRKIICKRNFFYLFACITFFPIVVQGPISRYDKLISQFEKLPKFDYDKFCKGLQLFLWGFFKKSVIADRISPFSNGIFGMIDEAAGVEIILALFFNMMLMYVDFSGCMDMVTGVSEVMGIKLETNFQQPFLSQSVPEFWRRWHMTLSAWFRDYVYMPIARSSWAKKLNKKARNHFDKHISESLTMSIPMFLVWLLTGLWHGTGNAYILWGLYWGALMFSSMLFSPYIEKFNEICHFKTETFGWKFFRIIRTDMVYCIAATIAAVGSPYGVRQVIKLFQRIFFEHRMWVLFNGEIFTHGMTAGDFAIVGISLLILSGVDIINYKGISIREKIEKQPIVFRWLFWILLIMMVMMWGRYGVGFDASNFIYEDF